MRIFFINNEGAGYADHIEIMPGTTVDTLFQQKMPYAKPHDYLIRVNRQPVARDQVLVEGDRRQHHRHQDPGCLSQVASSSMSISRGLSVTMRRGPFIFCFYSRRRQCSMPTDHRVLLKAVQLIHRRLSRVYRICRLRHRCRSSCGTISSRPLAACIKPMPAAGTPPQR